MITPKTASREYGLYKKEADGELRNLASPIWHWGKFYEKIVNITCRGGSDVKEMKGKQAINYWWGMSADVIDVICSQNLPHGTNRLITFLKNSIRSGSFQPFVGTIYSQDGTVQCEEEERLSPEEIITMNNGCICCTIRGDLAENLIRLMERKKEGKANFDRVIIETTGLADPGPVAQTFFMDEEVAQFYMVDGVITVVDAVNGPRTLDEQAPAQAQVGFADRILLSKVDLVPPSVIEDLSDRLHHMNPRAPIVECNMGNVDIKEVLDIRGFNLDSVLELDPDFLKEAHEEGEHHHHHEDGCTCGCHDHDHHDHDDHCECGDHDHDHCECGHHHHHARHDDEIAAFVFESDRPFDPARLDNYMRTLTQVYGPDMLRYKGVLYMTGTDRKMIFQGVHMLMAADLGNPWGDTKPSTKMVFIGRRLPKKAIMQGLETCLA